MNEMKANEYQKTLKVSDELGKELTKAIENGKRVSMTYKANGRTYEVFTFGVGGNKTKAYFADKGPSNNVVEMVDYKRTA